MKKTPSRRFKGSAPELPAAVLEKLRRAFQKPAHPDLPCPEPEQVINCALEELEPAAQQQIQNHLSTCRSCLELYLDVLLAQAEAASSAGGELQDSPRAGWLAALGRQVSGFLEALGKPRRLIPALAAVSLVLLVVIWGREKRSPLPPPPQLAMERQAAPTFPSGAPAPPEPSAAQPSAALPGSGLLAAKKKLEKAAPAPETFGASSPAPQGPIRLVLTEVSSDGHRLAYRADREVFALLLKQDRSGKIDLLQSGNLEAGKTYFYPAKNHLLQSDTAAPEATFFLVASPAPLADLQSKMQVLELQGPDRLEKIFPGAAIRSLSVRLP